MYSSIPGASNRIMNQMSSRNVRSCPNPTSQEIEVIETVNQMEEDHSVLGEEKKLKKSFKFI